MLVVAAVALLAGYIVHLLYAFGEFRQVDDLHPGSCRTIAGIAGPEDITWHPEDDVAFISSFDRRAAANGEATRGAIYRYIPGDEPVRMTTDVGHDFRPHGISLHAGPGGRATLLVVNHPGEPLFGAGPDSAGDQPRHAIEVFDVAGDRLVHRATHADPSMIRPNDVVAVDHRRFYFTNDHGAAPGWKRTVEDYLRLPWANVAYFDGETFTEVAGGLTYANGINLSPDGSRLYVAEVTRGRIREYARDRRTGTLDELRRIDVGFGVDNIEVDPDTGALWLGGHVKLLTFTRHAADTDVNAPSQAVRVRPDAEPVTETVFLDDGELISGASVAARRDGRLLLGSVFEPHVVECFGSSAAGPATGNYAASRAESG